MWHFKGKEGIRENDMIPKDYFANRAEETFVDQKGPRDRMMN